jgi:glycopeptide antibiotics resistance protein
MFGILGWLGLTYRKLKKQNIFVTFILLIILALGLEIIQYFIPWRTFNVNDMTANGVGVGLGMIVYKVFRTNRN